MLKYNKVVEVLRLNDFEYLEDRETTERIIIHHVGGYSDVEAIHNYHKNTLGWSGIGYHFLIGTDGLIWSGRPLQSVGAHTEGQNYDSVGIAINGDYTKDYCTPRAQSIAALCSLIAEIALIYNIDLSTSLAVSGHRDYCDTACPGEGLYNILGDIRKIARLQLKTYEELKALYVTKRPEEVDLSTIK